MKAGSSYAISLQNVNKNPCCFGFTPTYCLFITVTPAFLQGIANQQSRCKQQRKQYRPQV